MGVLAGDLAVRFFEEGGEFVGRVDLRLEHFAEDGVVGQAL